MSYRQQLITKIEQRNAVIGVIGLGYVGLPIAIRFAESGFQTIGFDIDAEKASAINEGRSYLHHIDGSKVRNAQPKLTATTQLSRVSELDAVLLCLPTPLTDDLEPDLSYVTDTMSGILPYLKPGQCLSLESTTYPGTTDEILRPSIESTGLVLGEDFFLVYSPEREDPGNETFNVKNIPKVVAGTTGECLEVGQVLYQAIVDRIVPVSSTSTAEMTKLLENIHRSVNIGLVNEMKIVADAMNIDIREVIDAAATKPFGFTPYYPGPGLGGHCLPIDPYYLTWKAKQHGVETRFIELAGEVNRSMPAWVVGKLVAALEAQEKPVSGSRVLIVGLAYKRNVGDTRESPAVKILDLLVGMGAEVAYHDPFLPKFPVMRGYHYELESVELSENLIKEFDALVIATDHSLIDYQLITRCSSLTIDCRGVYEQDFEGLVRT